MAILITINGSVTLDESSGLQTGGIGVPPEDNNDSDISLATLQADALSFYNRLFDLAELDLLDNFATANGLARSATNYISLTGTGSVITLGFVDANGAPLPVLGSGSGAATNLTALDGGAITLFMDPASELGNRVVYGVDEEGDIVFALFMQPATDLLSARVWMVQFEPMDNPVDTNHDDPLELVGLKVGAGVSTEFDFNALPSGQNLFGTVGSTSSGLIVFGKTTALNADGTFTNASNTINTSQGGGPTTIGVNNQMFDPGDGAYFTYVRNPVPDYLAGAPGGLTQGEADDADFMQYTGGTIESNSAFVKIAQLQGNGLATMQIAAFNIAGSPQGQALIGASGQTAVAITAVRVYNAAGTLVEDSDGSPNSAAITITFGTGVGGGGNGIPVGEVRVSGLDAGYKVEWDTNGVHDQARITGVAGKFDIGGFGVNEPTAVSAPLSGVRFEDDGPSVNINLNGDAALVLDETDNDSDDNDVGGILAQNSIQTGSYLTLNSANFGTDGESGNSPTVWSLSLTGANVNGVDSGLDDTLTNTNVMLFVVNSTTIVGKAGGSGGPTVMTITIDATTGELTVVQNRSVEHNDPNDDDESTSPAMINSGLVGATRAVTDGDGDQASDSVDVSQVFKFEDDGPSVDIELDPAAALLLDETENDGDDTAVDGILARNSILASDYLSVDDPSFGSDGQAGSNPTVWSLSLTGANVNGVDSGLNDTLSGDDVLLFVVNATTVVGKAGGSGGPVVMTITIDATTGELTVVQERAVEHDDSDDHDESGSPEVMDEDLVAAVRTITDGDGDSDSDSVDVSQLFKFEDDGPNVDLARNGDAKVTVDESTLSASAFITVGNLFTTNSAEFGSDGPGVDDSVYKLVVDNANSGLLDTATGDQVILSANLAGTLITGTVNDGVMDQTVFTIEVDPDTGEVTLTQYRAMVHDDPDDPDESTSPLSMASGRVSLERTITDGDGDSGSDVEDISSVFKFEDAGPVQPQDGQNVDNLITDDSFITDDADETTDDIFPDAPNYGSDGPRETDPITFNLELRDPEPGDGKDPDSGLIDTASGDAIRFVTDGNDIVGYVDDDGDGVIEAGETLEAVRYSLVSVPGDPDSFDVTFTQTRAVFHAPAATEETVLPNTVFVERHAFDGDGDPAEVVDFDLGEITFLLDDEPTIGPIPDGLVDFAKDDFVTKSLFGDVNNDPNAAPYILTAFTGSIVVNGVTVTGVLAGDSKSVTYWANTNGNGIIGDAGDTAYYNLALGDQGGPGDYTFTVLINPPPAFLEFNFSALPSGQNLFGTVGSTSDGLIVFGKTPVLNADGTFTNASNTINTSQGGGPTTIGVNNQMFDPGDGAYFTFVKNPVPDYLAGAPGGLTQGEADDADFMQYTGGTLEATSAFVKIAQIQGNALATMQIAAFNIAGAPQGQALVGARGSGQVDVTKVIVYNAAGTKIEDSSVGGAQDPNVVITFGTGVGGGGNGIPVDEVRVSGLGAGYKVEWFTNAVHDQVLITGVAGKFDVGGFGISQAQPTPDQLLSFTAKVTDGDGDFATDSWNIGIDGTGIHDDDAVAGVSII